MKVFVCNNCNSFCLSAPEDDKSPKVCTKYTKMSNWKEIKLEDSICNLVQLLANTKREA